MREFIIQGIGVLAHIILMLSYQRKKKIQILLMQIFASIAFAIHYYWLSGITGAICNIISLIMMIVIYLFERKSKKNNKGMLVGIMVTVTVIISLFTWEDIFSIFPIVATIVILMSFLLDNENVIRIIGIIGAISWLIYGIIHVSYSAIIFEIITIITTIVAIVRNRKSVNL